MQEAMFLIILILAIAYTGLTLYFEHRQEKKNKEWKEKLNQ
jgi:Ni,Fe-hydrogenase I cytochrome b subunit